MRTIGVLIAAGALAAAAAGAGPWPGLAPSVQGPAGVRYTTTQGSGETIVTAMTVEDPQTLKTEFLKSFRQFADEQGEDRQALAAFSQAFSPALDRDTLGRLDMPVLVVAGSGDDLAGDPEELARLFPHGKGVRLPGCDHFSAIPHASLKATVLDFLDGMLEDDFPPFE